jgi:hypothetical protein
MWPSLKPFVTFHNKLIFYHKELLALRPTPKLEDYLMSAVIIFAATIHIYDP